MSTVQQTFLYSMVTAEFFGFRNYDRDLRAEALAEQLNKELPQVSEAFALLYAQLLVYTERFLFNWAEGAPDHYLALEEWWDMVETGKPPADCYQYFIRSVDNDTARGYILAMQKAHRPWRPAEARPDDELTAEELADPNSNSAAEPSVMTGGAG